VAGLIAGAAAVAGALLLVRRRRSNRPMPLGGLLVALAFLLGLAVVRRAPSGLAIGVALLVIAGLPAVLESRSGPLIGLFLSAAGSGSIAFWGALPDRAWLRITVLLSVPAAAWLLRDFELGPGRAGIGLVLLPVSAAGVFAGVPNTEQALLLLGVTAPLALVGWPRPLATLGPGWAPAVAGVYVWVVAVGGSLRAGAVIGGLGCLGLLAAEPLARAISAGKSRLPFAWPSGLAAAAVGLIHGVLVLVCSRMAGVRRSAWVAGLIAGGTLAAATLALAALGRLRRRR
jgi:hypothetical protein